MKSVLRKIFTKEQRTWLYLFKEKILLGFSRFFAKALMLLLPRRILINVKKNLNLVEKLDYPKKDISLHIDSDVEYLIRKNSCQKEPETVQWIETHFSKGDVVYDIGANVGTYSLVASKYFDGQIKVYAFEPGFQNFYKLMDNIILNQCQESVYGLSLALSDRTGLTRFNYSNLDFGGALHALGESIDQKGNTFDPVLRQPVLAFALDDVVAQFSIEPPNHIKIDVDGLELQILQGAKRVLSQRSLKSILVEIEERGDEHKIIDLIEKNGLKFQKKYKYTFGGNEASVKTYNYLFSRV